MLHKVGQVLDDALYWNKLASDHPQNGVVAKGL